MGDKVVVIGGVRGEGQLGVVVRARAGGESRRELVVVRMPAWQ